MRETPLARETRPVLDAAGLPDVVFGPRDIMWWGTLGFVLIEGFTLALCAAVLVYTRQNYTAWPPSGTPLPSLTIPVIQLVTMLASLGVIAWLRRVALAYDLAQVRLALLVATLFMVAFCVLRYLELRYAIHVKWDTNAYGSAQWLVIVSHGTLLAVELIEIAGMALVFWMGPVERKHFSDAADAGFYWYFMILAWVPLFALCYLGPRWF